MLDEIPVLAILREDEERKIFECGAWFLNPHVPSVIQQKL